MHKSAMQMQHARDLQRGVGPNTGSGTPGAGSLGGIGTGSLSGLPAVMGAGTEVKPHQCQQCLKSFSSNHQLVQHIRVHTGEKPYKCSYCDRRFKQLSHVQQHTRLHTGKTFNFLYRFILIFHRMQCILQLQQQQHPKSTNISNINMNMCCMRLMQSKRIYMCANPHVIRWNKKMARPTYLVVRK